MEKGLATLKKCLLSLFCLSLLIIIPACKEKEKTYKKRIIYRTEEPSTQEAMVKKTKRYRRRKKTAGAEMAGAVETERIEEAGLTEMKTEGTMPQPVTTKKAKHVRKAEEMRAQSAEKEKKVRKKVVREKKARKEQASKKQEIIKKTKKVRTKKEKPQMEQPEPMREEMVQPEMEEGEPMMEGTVTTIS
jgi:hypothetical protein